MPVAFEPSEVKFVLFIIVNETVKDNKKLAVPGIFRKFLWSYNKINFYLFSLLLTL
jgi:hypothetical protein